MKEAFSVKLQTDRKPLVLLKIKIKQTPRCPNK